MISSAASFLEVFICSCSSFSEYVHISLVLLLLLSRFMTCYRGVCCTCRGADPRAVNGEGKTTLELAIESNFDDADVLALLADANG